MTRLEVIKSWDLEHMVHFLSSITTICKRSDDLDCAACTHMGDDLCCIESCINWLKSEVEV